LPQRLFLEVAENGFLLKFDFGVALVRTARHD
jgi:hypothetical protein